MIELQDCADDSGASLRMHLPAEADTEALGAALAACLRPGLHIWLHGHLGSGKTTLVRGLLRKCGFGGKVKSPTYTLIEPYAVSSLDFYHFDFYRFNSPEEYLDAGLDEYFGNAGVCVVEWPEKALPFLPAADLEVRIEADGDGRSVAITGNSGAGRTCVIDLLTSLKSPT